MNYVNNDSDGDQLAVVLRSLRFISASETLCVACFGVSFCTVFTFGVSR